MRIMGHDKAFTVVLEVGETLTVETPAQKDGLTFTYYDPSCFILMDVDGHLILEENYRPENGWETNWLGSEEPSVLVTPQEVSKERN